LVWVYLLFILFEFSCCDFTLPQMSIVVEYYIYMKMKACNECTSLGSEIANDNIVNEVNA